jgi:RNA polymerase sigma-70 factor (ECF subfamily)
MMSDSPVVHAEDKRLVTRLLAGDEAAFRRFFADHYRRLYRFALRRVGQDAAAAEDAAQSALSRALENLAGYRGEAQLFTWLCAICRSEIAQWQRKTGRREAHVVLTEDCPETRAAVDSFAADSDDPEAELWREQHARHVQVALDRLPPHYGDALEWKYVEGLSALEVAARLSVSLDAANSLLARAKRAFKETYVSLIDEGLDRRSASAAP